MWVRFFLHHPLLLKLCYEKLKKKNYFVGKSAEISPKMNNFTMKKYLTNTVEYWGRIRIAVECIQFWNVGFEYLQKSRIFVEYPVFGYSVTPLTTVYQVAKQHTHTLRKDNMRKST